MPINEKLMNLTEEQLKGLVDKIFLAEKERRAKQHVFEKSELFFRMVEDVKFLGEQFSQDDFYYEKIHPKLGWAHISEDTIDLFFSIMTSFENAESIESDESVPFENYTLVKRGLKVFIMIGQGTYVAIEPVEETKKE